MDCAEPGAGEGKFRLKGCESMGKSDFNHGKEWCHPVCESGSGYCKVLACFNMRPQECHVPADDY